MMLRAIFILFCLCVSFSAFGSCSAEKISHFHETWRKFYAASLTEKPEVISDFYNFPLKLLPPQDGGKSIVISKNIFIKNYSEIFLQSTLEEDNDIYTDFKKFKNMSDDHLKNSANTASCDINQKSGSIIFMGDYEFRWSISKGWRIYGVDYAGIQRRNFLFSLKHELIKK